jgi:hypothetical protein
VDHLDVLLEEVHVLAEGGPGDVQQAVHVRLDGERTVEHHAAVVVPSSRRFVDHFRM